MTVADDDLRWCDVGAVDEWNTGHGRAVRIGARRIGVYRLGEDFHACKDRCPHQNQSLVEGSCTLDAQGTPVVRCPAHGWCFDLRNGQQIGSSLQGTARVATYPVRVRAGRVEVGI